MADEFDEFVGVDGCKGGWIAVALACDGKVTHSLVPTIEALVKKHARGLVLVDVPIGLRDSGPDERLCDPEARAQLKDRGSSVFPAPVRAALYAADHGAACAVNLQMTRGKRALSIQSWAIAPKIREVNEYLAARTVRLPLVREMHPKLCFWALNGARPLSHKKQSKKGYEERIDLLSRHQADPAKVVTTVRREHGLDLVQRDDVVDALVGAVTAWLGRESLKTLPEKPEHDSAGLPMEMVYFPLNTERVVHVPALQEPLAPSKEAVVTEQPKPNLRGSPPQRGGSLGTTRPGYLNRNGQEVIRSTGKPGTDHGQYVYVLRCRACGREYGANGSDIFQRKCPGCQRGAPGLAD